MKTKKINLLILVICLILLLSNNALAKSKKALSKIALSHSITSVGSIVKGTITLAAPKNLSTLSEDLQNIFLGDDSKIKRRKKIKVEGSNSGSTLSLQGVTDKDYSFYISLPRSLNSLFSEKKFKFNNFGSIEISYPNKNVNFGSISNASSIIKVPTEIKTLSGHTKKKANVLSGTFRSTDGSSKKAIGRFILNLE